MHGLIFASLRDYTRQRLGEEEAEALWADAAYEPAEVYADEDFQSRLERVCAATGADLDESLHDFGSFAGETTFAALYPGYYAEAAGTRAFLLGVEERIHQVVRATIPGAIPPHLRVSELGPDGAIVTYTSSRRLCALLEGLVRGTARYYGEEVELEQIQCMHRGDPGCVLTVLPAGATSGSGGAPAPGSRPRPA